MQGFYRLSRLKVRTPAVNINFREQVQSLAAKYSQYMFLFSDVSMRISHWAHWISLTAVKLLEQLHDYGDDWRKANL